MRVPTRKCMSSCGISLVDNGFDVPSFRMSVTGSFLNQLWRPLIAVAAKPVGLSVTIKYQPSDFLLAFSRPIQNLEVYLV